MATLLGGVSDDDIRDVAVAPDGTVYVTGTTESADFPATDGAYDTALGGQADAFVARLSADLSSLLAATYLGGTSTDGSDNLSRDEGYGIALTEDAVYVVGSTFSIDFPVTPGTFQQERASSDAFVARLNLDLSTLEAATYFGGDDSDFAVEVAIGPQGGIIFAGVTDGPNFPLSDGAYSPNSGPVEGPFVTRLSPDLTELRASTRFNGSGEVNALAVDPETGDAAIVGTTGDNGFPSTANAFDTTCGTDGACNFVHPFDGNKSDAFVSRMSHDATTLVASTFLGGEAFDYGTALAWVDGEIVVAGLTESQVFPVSSDAFQTFHENGNLVGYVARFDEMLSLLSRSTTFSGTVSRDAATIRDLYVESGTGNVQTVGWTRANDLPLTLDAFDQGFTGEREQFYSVFDAELSDLVFSSFLGGTDPAADAPIPSANAIAVGTDGSLYVAGTARAADFFTSEDAYQPDLAGNADGFVTRLVDGNPVANESDGAQPDITTLLPGYPNPFAVATTLRYELAEPAAVRLAVYDALGREVAVLVEGRQPAGAHAVRFDGRGLAGGTYLVRLQAGEREQVRPVVIIR